MLIAFACVQCGGPGLGALGDALVQPIKKQHATVATNQEDVVGGQTPSDDNPGVGNAVALLSSKSLCTGALISDDVVVTAGHCVIDGAPSLVIFGTDIRDRLAPRRKVVASGSALGNIRMFPNNDVAWVRFQGGLPAGFRPIPVLGNAKALRTGDLVVVDGFGVKASNADAKTAGKLLTATTSFEAYHNDHDFQKIVTLGPNPGRGTCHGDSGGPAYVRMNGSWMLLGTTSGRNKVLTPEMTCEAGHSVQSFTGDYLDWLSQSTGEDFPL